MVSTHLKNISQIGNLPLIGVKIKNIWNHHPVVDLARFIKPPKPGETPIFRSSLVPSVAALFPKMSRGHICNLVGGSNDSQDPRCPHHDKVAPGPSMTFPWEYQGQNPRVSMEVSNQLVTGFRTYSSWLTTYLYGLEFTDYLSIMDIPVMSPAFFLVGNNRPKWWIFKGQWWGISTLRRPDFLGGK